MPHRTVEIAWLPRTRCGWAAFSAARREAARLWSRLVRLHAFIRAHHWPWPTKYQLMRWAQGKFPHLHSQSVQQLIGEFCEAVASARQLRKHGYATARYPHRTPRYHDVVYTNQAAKLRGRALRLPNGQSGPLQIRLPRDLALPGRLMEVRLSYGVVRLVCAVDHPLGAQPAGAGPVIGVDLGVNTLLAASDGQRAVLISGRAAKATVQWRNKRLATLQARQARLGKGSRRHKRLQRRKYKLLAKARRRVRDLCHKASRKVADAFPGARCYVGEPFNAAAQTIGRKQAQQVSQAATRRLIGMLGYKTAGATLVNEAYTSQTCPVCGERSKHGRVYRCGCGVVAPRDVVGATNIRTLGTGGRLQAGGHVPNVVTWAHPSKYPGPRQVVPADTRQVACGPPQEAAGL